MKLTCIFVEDETPAMNLLKIYADRTPTLEVLGFFDSSMEAIHFLSENPVDVIFTDVNMPQLTGIELTQSLRNKPYIIFITANAEYAVNGFELDIVDFLVKPVTFERFMKSVNKVFDREEKKKLGGVNNHNEIENKEELEDYSMTSIYVKESGKVIRIDFDEIIAIEGLKDYVKIITDERPIVTHLTMKKLEEQILPKSKFMRVHKSFIVGLRQIRKFDGLDCYLELQNKLQIPVGPQYKEALMVKLKPVN
ncbi:LytTR family two component transcriptional regulator [Arcicella aurantiaca]|uniref:LytTR family two component transcriptional regulator n=1 Tax=Arcicella aurantiaca TaxID=591202 RepID=A0A316E0B6_9BACT|nr:LytTR family DNA-binding domain-containing protein [Arcicella aurantiaca]PWK23884.1 LytTR family two component transcriptional regulator [Arcicella aurantiaca]